MAVKFRLVKRNNLGKDQNELPQKIYAQSVYTGKVAFNELLADIVEAGIPTSQVKAVLDRMSHLIRKHLDAGRIVQFGEFGNFRYSLGSTGSATKEEFLSSQIKQPKIIFTPGAVLRHARKDADFQHEEPRVVTEECNLSHF